MSCVLVWLLVAGGPSAVAGPSCTPNECLLTIQEHAAVTLAEAKHDELVGIWSQGGGLAGSILYLFQDGTYIYTEWADVMAEMIYDKGKWQAIGGVVTLSSDPEVTWRVEGDQRYLALVRGGSGERVLFGIDRGMAAFRQFVSQKTEYSGADWVRAIGLRRTPWKPAQPGQTRRRLLTHAWHPEWHMNSK